MFFLIVIPSAACSVIGGVIICVGFYVVIWGKANDEEGENEDSSKISLLQSP